MLLKNYCKNTRTVDFSPAETGRNCSFAINRDTHMSFFYLHFRFICQSRSNIAEYDEFSILSYNARIMSVLCLAGVIISILKFKSAACIYYNRPLLAPVVTDQLAQPVGTLAGDSLLKSAPPSNDGQKAKRIRRCALSFCLALSPTCKWRKTISKSRQREREREKTAKNSIAQTHE